MKKKGEVVKLHKMPVDTTYLAISSSHWTLINISYKYYAKLLSFSEIFLIFKMYLTSLIILVKIYVITEFKKITGLLTHVYIVQRPLP